MKRGGKRKRKIFRSQAALLFQSINCCLAWLKATNLNKLGMPVFSPADTVPALFRFLRVNELALKESFKEPC